MEIPKIENIHNLILSSIEDNSLEMSHVHTCKTTHCWAGWAVHVAGELGYKLEKETDWLFAAMQIFKKNSPIKINPCWFFESNQEAMDKIKECAKKELENN